MVKDGCFTGIRDVTPMAKRRLCGGVKEDSWLKRMQPQVPARFGELLRREGIYSSTLDEM